MSGLNRQRWINLWQALCASWDPFPWFHKLDAAYSEGHRFYHNSTHIAECLSELDTARQLAHEPVAVELAIWFHDVVYDPRAQDNEEQSAALAEDCLSEAAVASELRHTVAQLIQATKHHDVIISPDAPVIVDVDLSILGQPVSRFMEYETEIRQEYFWVPESTFKLRRAEILERFLARKRLYATDWFHHKYEQQARSNLQMSLRKLKGLNA